MVEGELDFEWFCQKAQELDNTSKDKEKAEIVSSILDESGTDIRVAARFVKGDIFPSWKDKKLSIGRALSYKILSEATGQSEDAIEEITVEEGDIGRAVEALDFDTAGGQATLGTTVKSTNNTLSRIYNELNEVAEVSGSGSQQEKIDRISKLVNEGSQVEAKYLMRLVRGKMRIGVGEGTVRDAISNSFDISTDKVETAIMLRNDIGEIAEKARDEGVEALENLDMSVGRPIESMKAKDSSEAAETTEKLLTRLGNKNGGVGVEFKFDGARLQIHKKQDEVSLFTQNLNDVTESLPDVVETVKEKVSAEEAIIDSEVIGYDAESGEQLEFKEVMTRLRREHEIEEKAEEVNMDFHAFDLMYVNGRSIIHRPFAERRELLEENCKLHTEQWIFHNSNKVDEKLRTAEEENREGLMVKDLESEYSPGKRGFDWVKVKPENETLDVVIINAHQGTGSNDEWFSSFGIAVKDEESGELKQVGKVSNGFTEKDLEEYTERINNGLSLGEKEDSPGVTEVEPEIVVEVEFEKLQESPDYECGYATRFPVFKAERYDKDVDDADTIQRVKDMGSDSKV